MRLLPFLIVLITLQVAAQPEPLAAQKGATTELKFESLPGKPITLWTSFPTESAPLPDGRFRLNVPTTAPLGIGAIRVFTTTGASRLQLLMIDDLPTRQSPDGNLTPPCAVDGATSPLALTTYHFSAHRGQRISIEVVANRIGSHLDPILRLLDSANRELAYCDDTPSLGSDCAITHTFATDGEYHIELRDVNYDGGPDYRFHLRIGDFDLPHSRFPQSPTDLVATTAIALPATISGRFSSPGHRDSYTFAGKANERIAIRALARSIGSSCDLQIRLLDPNGNSVTEIKPTEPKKEDPKQPAPPLSELTPIEYMLPADGSYTIRVQDAADRAGDDYTYRLQVQRSAPGFDLTIEDDTLSASPGTTIKLNVKCTRRSFGEPIALRLAGTEPTDVELMTPSLKSGQTDAQIELKIPANAHSATFTLIGTATIDGKDYTRTASTLPALRKLFPRIIYPLPQLDGIIAVGVKLPDSTK